MIVHNLISLAGWYYMTFMRKLDKKLTAEMTITGSSWKHTLMWWTLGLPGLTLMFLAIHWPTPVLPAVPSDSSSVKEEE